LASLRSYQEAHTNYFEDLEQRVIVFQSFHVNMEVQISIEELTAILIEEYGYTIEEFFGTRSVGRFAIYLFQKAKHYYFQRI
jgi:hypothetical protein